MDDVIEELTEVSNTLSGEHYFILTGSNQRRLAALVVASSVVGCAIVRGTEILACRLAARRAERGEEA